MQFCTKKDRKTLVFIFEQVTKNTAVVNTRTGFATICFSSSGFNKIIICFSKPKKVVVSRWFLGYV